MIELLKGLFRGDRFINAKHLDNQFDAFMGYVDVTEKELGTEIDALEEKLDDVLVKVKDLIVALKLKLERTEKKASKPKVSKKVKAKKK